MNLRETDPARENVLRISGVIVVVALVVVGLAIYGTADGRELTSIGKWFFALAALVALFLAVGLFCATQPHVVYRIIYFWLVVVVFYLAAVILALAGSPIVTQPYTSAQFEADRTAAQKHYTAKAVVGKSCRVSSKENDTGFTFFKVGDNCVAVRGAATSFMATFYSSETVTGSPRGKVYTVIFPAGRTTTVLLLDPEGDSIHLAKADVEKSLSDNARQWRFDHMAEQG